MKISIIGTGYVGLVTGVCFAGLGHEVVCHDIDEQKIENLKNGILPIYEPGLKDLIKRNINNLTFTSEIKMAMMDCEVVMSAVGTPPGKDHQTDLRYVKAVAKNFGENIDRYTIFVNKSTVPVGTGEICREIIADEIRSRGLEIEFDVVSNPEFLREGQAIKDTLEPERIVVGVDNEKSKKIMEKVYKPYTDAGFELFFTDIKTAEIIKYAANSFLATKISFINQIANFCEKTGGNVREVAKGIGLDSRIGAKFLEAGIGYGGSCFPKDVKALIYSGKEAGFDFSILEAVDAVNNQQKIKLVEKFKKHFEHLAGKKVAILGLAFKPETDDLRCAPALDIIEKLLESGVKVRAYDPVAMEQFRKLHGEIVDSDFFDLAEDVYAAVDGADCLMLVTEWKYFGELDFDRIKKLMRGNVILDGRNFWNDEGLGKIGFKYEGIGL